MWVFPLLAALVAAAFTALLARQYLQRLRPYQALWAVALDQHVGSAVFRVEGLRARPVVAATELPHHVTRFYSA